MPRGTTNTLASLSARRSDDDDPAAILHHQWEHPEEQPFLTLREIRESPSWQAHAPLVDDFRVPGDLIGPDVRLVTRK